MSLGALLLSAALAASQAPKLVVLELRAAGGVEPAVAGALSETLAAEAAGRGYFQVISSREVQTLIGAERQKELLGCSEDAQSCLAELSGGLDARFILSGTLARLGEAYQLSLQTLDSQKAQTVGRSTKLAKDLATLQALVPWAVAEATGTPLPPPPSRLLHYSLIAGGALLGVAGAILGQDALSEARAVNAELELGRARPGNLLTLAEYQQRDQDLRLRGYIALGALVAGAGLIATGALTLPADTPMPAGASAWLVPGPAGLALFGTFH